jgi:hypothetical protein
MSQNPILTTIIDTIPRTRRKRTMAFFEAPRKGVGVKYFPTRILLAFFFLILAPAVFGQQPTPIVPDPTLTPGSSFPVTVQDLCVPGYTKKVRNVPAEMKREVYEEYGVTSHGSGDYEVDHLIPLELGGSNSIKNLWPESHRTSPWNAQVKDRLEGKLHELVCTGQLDLKAAQQAIASDWIGAYKLYVSPNPPVSRVVSSAAAATPLNAGDVWVNTRSGRYWKPGSRYYGKTKQGEYLSEEEAVQKGYLPANGTGQ